MRQIRRSLTSQTLLTLVRALVVSKVDYYNSVLSCVSAHLLNRLQSVLNAAARPPPSYHGGRNASARYSVNSTGCVFWREFDSGLYVLVFRCLNGMAPSYLTDSLRRAAAADVDGRRHLRLANTMSLVVPSTRRSTLGDRAFPAAAA